jgi:hypothetical protein
MAPNQNLMLNPADTSLKGDLSIDIALDPCSISWDSPFNDDTTVYRRAFSPIFYSAWIFSDRRQIFADYRTAHLLHCKEKKFRKFSKLF